MEIFTVLASAGLSTGLYMLMKLIRQFYRNNDVDCRSSCMVHHDRDCKEDCKEESEDIEMK